MVLQDYAGALPNHPPQPPLDPADHTTYMRLALSQAYESPPLPTNYRVGALLVDSSTGDILSTGYTLELPGNTHAEQCALQKYAQSHNITTSSDEEILSQLGHKLPEGTVLYTTMEPCNLRLSGNMCCVDRILKVRRRDGKCAIGKVYVGVREPEKFVGENEGRGKLEGDGVQVCLVGGLEEDILRVAMAGHVKEGEEEKKKEEA